ncbi:MAG: hypothetical protein PHU25_21875 [Deltaproteobacteria bacterium]|nr:hypothetical protein [Deltaproteobacteria bacterium]
MLARSFGILLLSCAILPGVVHADDATSPEKAEWFHGFFGGAGGGVAFMENAARPGFPVNPVIGPELGVAIFRYNLHRVVLTADYLNMLFERNQGSEQVRVTTSYQRVDLWAAYEVQWKLLVAGLRIGTALTIVQSRESIYDFQYHLENDQLVFTDRAERDHKESLGVSPGLVTGLDVGLALLDDGLEIRARGGYVRRGERDEFEASGWVVVWPMVFF